MSERNNRKHIPQSYMRNILEFQKMILQNTQEISEIKTLTEIPVTYLKREKQN